MNQRAAHGHPGRPLPTAPMVEALESRRLLSAADIAFAAGDIVLGFGSAGATHPADLSSPLAASNVGGSYSGRLTITRVIQTAGKQFRPLPHHEVRLELSNPDRRGMVSGLALVGGVGSYAVRGQVADERFRLLLVGWRNATMEGRLTAGGQIAKARFTGSIGAVSIVARVQLKQVAPALGGEQTGGQWGSDFGVRDH